VAYQKYVSGFDTMAAREYNDTAQIVDEAATIVYMRKVRAVSADGPMVWAHIPNHKVAEAGGDPYGVEFLWVPKWNQYCLAAK
jgi:hypothetical protein